MEDEVIIKISFPLRTRIFLFFRDLKWKIKRFLGVKEGPSWLESTNEHQSWMRQWKADCAKAPDSLSLLLLEGWYLPFDFNEATINHLADKLKQGQMSFIESTMIDTFNDRGFGIIEMLVTRFPSRKEPILEAFDAHSKGKYYLSIPVFFAQTEGICAEIVGNRFFKVPNGGPSTKNWANNFVQDEYTKLLLTPLVEVGEARRKQDVGNPSGINRHDVLHGDCSNYGTKVNSYKALSLLAYIGITVYELKEWFENQANQRHAS